MANVVVEEQSLIDIASAIRTKNETDNTYKPSEMANAILDITTSEDLSSELNTQETLLNNQTSKISNAIDILKGKASGGSSDNSYWLSILDRSITKLENEEITILGNYAINECTQMTSVNLPNVTKIGSYCFRQCTALTDISFSNNYTIGSACFIYCTGLKNINLRGLFQANSNCFGYCSGLENVFLPDTEIFQTYVFRECTNLKVVDLPKVKTINANGFLNDISLEKVILRKDSVCTLLNKNAFTGSSIESGTGYIYVPDELVDSYKTATNWSTYASQIKPLSELEV